MPTVDVPDIGTVDFPDSMDQGAMTLAIKRMQKEKPGFWTKAAASAAGTLLKMGEMGKGFVKEAANESKNLGDIALDPVLKKTPPIPMSNEDQKSGGTAFQIGSAFTPVGEEFTAAKVIPKASIWLKGLYGAGKEALDVGVRNYAQTGDVKDSLKAAGIGAGFGAVGAMSHKAAPVLRRSAEKEYAEVLAPSGKADKFVTKNKLLKQPGKDLLDRRVGALTEEGLKSKIDRRVTSLGDQLDKHWKSLGPQAQQKLIPILDDIQAQAVRAATEEVGPRQFPTPGLENRRIMDQKLYDAYQHEAMTLLEHLGPRADEASSWSLRKVRQLMDKKVKNSFRGAEITSEAAEAKRASTDAVRRMINGGSVDMKALNAEISFWMNAQEVFGNTSMRRIGQKGTLEKLAGGLMAAGGAAAGFHAGGARESIEFAILGRVAGQKLEQTLNSTAWKTVSAISKNEVARLLATGKGEQAAGLAARLTARAVQKSPSVDSTPPTPE
jgi:hypothetical protein